MVRKPGKHCNKPHYTVEENSRQKVCGKELDDAPQTKHMWQALVANMQFFLGNRNKYKRKQKLQAVTYQRSSNVCFVSLALKLVTTDNAPWPSTPKFPQEPREESSGEPL